MEVARLFAAQIFVEGRLQTRKWDDKDGNTKYTTEVRADRVVLLGRRDAAGEGGPGPERQEPQERQQAPAMSGAAPAPSDAAPAPELTEDDIPF